MKLFRWDSFPHHRKSCSISFALGYCQALQCPASRVWQSKLPTTDHMTKLVKGRNATCLCLWILYWLKVYKNSRENGDRNWWFSLATTLAASTKAGQKELNSLLPSQYRNRPFAVACWFTRRTYSRRFQCCAFGREFQLSHMEVLNKKLR